MPVLPDLLRYGLDIVFCGMAPSAESARRKAYYAHPGNRFWRTLHEVGLTERLLAPAEYRSLLGAGIGFTDICKTASGRDAELPKAALDPGAVRRKIEKFRPRFVGCTSKTVAKHLLGHACDYGLQAETIGMTHIFVLPSTSGTAAGYWSIGPWRDLAKAVRTGRARNR